MTTRKRVAVWGTGNVGRPAIRAVLSHRDLELAGVIVSNPGKAGRDAGDLVGAAATGILATTDAAAVLSLDLDAVVYTASADMRPQEALDDILSCLRGGVNVVSTSFYSLLYPKTAPADMLGRVQAACTEGNSSVFVSGIDPGWALDILPMLLSGVVSDIREIRCQEIFNYAHYDQPEVVRNLIGFGGSMDDLPVMLQSFALEMVWAPMVRILGDALASPVDRIETFVQRRALTRTIDVANMGRFEEGTQGAFRFEVRGYTGDKPRFVVEHITRIDDECAPDWPRSPEPGGCHRVILSGTPDLIVTIHGADAVEPGPAGGGNATAANRIVNSIPAVCAARAGVLTPLDLPAVYGGAQLR